MTRIKDFYQMSTAVTKNLPDCHRRLPYGQSPIAKTITEGEQSAGHERPRPVFNDAFSTYERKLTRRFGAEVE